MGRHSKPKESSRTGQRIATVTSAVALASAGIAVEASAATATPTGILDAIEECESGGRNVPNSTGASTASGHFQFLDGTWQGLGYSGRAMDHPYSTQREAAEKLLAMQGTSPWNASKSCWQGKANAKSSSQSSTSGKSKRADRDSTARGEQAAPKATPKKAKAAPSGETYTVKKGDYLSKIARVRNVDGGWRALYAANDTEISNPAMIYPGQKLVLP